MRSLVIIILASFTGLLTACTKSRSEGVEGPETSLSIKLNHCSGTIFTGTSTNLCFESIISDSRCPANLTCIWEGTATAKFIFTVNGTIYPLTLSTVSLSPTFEKTVIVAGYKLEFINLEPYPGIPNPPNEVRAEVKVTKL